MWLPRFIRDFRERMAADYVDNLPLRKYMQLRASQIGGWEAKVEEDRILDVLLMDSPNASLSDLENMKWREVKFKVKRAERRVSDQLKMLQALLSQNSKVASFLNDPSWGFSIGTLPSEDEMLERNL